MKRKMLVGAMLRIAIVVFAVVGVSVVSAQNRMTPNPDGHFQFNAGTSTITRYIGDVNRVVVPSEINGRPVAAIGDGAFRNNQLVTEVLLPPSVTSIGSNAFYGSALRYLTVQGTLRSIGNNAFQNTNLQAFLSNWPSGVRSIPVGLYQGSNLNGNLVIPEGVTEIGNYAFAGTQITSVTLPRSILRIGNAAFAGCTMLRTVTIPSSVTSLIFGTNAFAKSINTYSSNVGNASIDEATRRRLATLGYSHNRWE